MTYKERLVYLYSAMDDEDCPAHVYRTYRTQALDIYKRHCSTGPDAINDLDEEM